MSRPAITPARVELIYFAALFGYEELRDQLRWIGFEDPGPEDSAVLRAELLGEVERLRRGIAEGEG